MTWRLLGAIVALSLGAAVDAAAHAEAVGRFTDHKDIGAPKVVGAASFDPGTGTYRVTGGGANMWTDRDDFHFVWKRMSGNVEATADLVFHSPSPVPGASGYVHRKGGLIIRQDLDTDSAYVDALRMGNQQLSLQYRETKGGQTHLIWINTPNQRSVRLEKIGDYAYLSVPGPDGKLHHAGGSFKLKITGPYYIGIGVCAHDNNVAETMDFTNVKIRPIARKPEKARETTLQTMGVDNMWEQTAVVNTPGAIKSPRWSPDGKSFVYGSGGRFYRVPAEGAETAAPVRIGADDATSSNTADGVSADGRWVYFSAVDKGGRKLWRAHPDGSGRMQITFNSDTRDWAPHASPDGKWIVYLTTGTEGPADRPLGETDVELRLIPVADGVPDTSKTEVFAKLFGGPGTLDRQPWSPDSKNFAFVSYRPAS